MAKRIWAAVLALSLIASFFVFDVAAYDNPSQCSLQLPGFGTIGLVDGISNASKLFFAGNTSQSVSNLYVVNPKHNDYIQFVLWIDDGGNLYPHVYSTAVSVGNSINNDEWIVVKRAIRVPIKKADGSIYAYASGVFVTAKFVGSDYSGTKSVNLGCSFTVNNSNSNATATSGQFSYPVLSNVLITSDVSLILQNILNTENDIYDDLNNFLYGSADGLWPAYYMLQERTNGYLNDLRRKFTITSTFDYVSISYDADGNASTGTGKTTWYQALLNTINSLTMPFKEQVEQEQKAKDAGADDALDLAYDSVGSSFGALGDFSGLGSLGSFDGDALGQAGTGGLLSWFSKENADAIDAVPRSKAHEDIVDFYTPKIEIYREEVNSDDGTTDTSGN